MAKQSKENNVRIRILPLKGIGGVGSAGDIAWMTQEEADHWVKEGYVEILPDEDEPVPASAEKQGDVVEEDHKIMKPRPKRN